MCRIGLRTLKQIVVYSSFCCIFRHVLWKEWLLQQYHQHNREHKKWASTRIDAIVAVVAHTSRKCKQNKRISNPFWKGGSSKQSLCFGMVVYDGWFPDRTSPRFASIPKWNNKKIRQHEWCIHLKLKAASPPLCYCWRLLYFEVVSIFARREGQWKELFHLEAF